MRVIQREQLPFHPLLGRNVNHDSASRAYPVKAAGHALVSRRHNAFIGVLDQGALGACTGNSGVSAIYHQPFTNSLHAPAWAFQPNQAGAVALYSAATAIDPFQGTYPPEDTGSDGLSVAKVLKARGVIKGYRWAFSLAEALDALQETPLITGVNWYQSMFEPDSLTGIMTIDRARGLSGGHEVCVDEYVAPEDSPNGRALVGGPNSWGTSWGRGGRWYLAVTDWESLLAERGDVTQFVPLSQPAPVPDPILTEDGAGDELWAKAKAWAFAPHTGSNRRAATAVKEWARKTNRS